MSLPLSARTALELAPPDVLTEPTGAVLAGTWTSTLAEAVSQIEAVAARQIW